MGTHSARRDTALPWESGAPQLETRREGMPPPGLAALDGRIPCVRFTVLAPACCSGVLQLAQEQHSTVAVQLGHLSADGALEDGYGVWERLTSIRVDG